MTSATLADPHEHTETTGSGFTREAVKSGTEITIIGYRAKNGANRANGRDLILPDGSRLFMSSSGTGAPGDTEGDGAAEPQ